MTDFNWSQRAESGRTPTIMEGEITTTTAVNIDKYNSTDVGAANAIHVQPGTSVTWDMSDRPGRDIGKVDIASLDQYTPVSGKLPVDASGVTLTIEATNLDIRDLTSTDVVTVTGGAGQTADVKVTLDSESVAVTGPLTDAQLRNSDVKITLDSEAVSSNIYGYRSSDTSFQPLRLDKSTNSIQVIDYSHHEIHAGSHFSIQYYATSKNDGQTINVYFKTPNTTSWIHMFMKWSASGAAFGRIREAPTVTSNTGTNGQGIINNNRNSATASGVLDNATSPVANKYGYDVTVTAPGTIIYEEYAGVAKTEGGAGRNDDEYILDQDTAYVFEVESDAAGITLSLRLGWYEHTDIA